MCINLFNLSKFKAHYVIEDVYIFSKETNFFEPILISPEWVAITVMNELILF